MIAESQIFESRAFESQDLKTLRETTSRTLLGLLWLHVPICLAIGLMRGTDWLSPLFLMAIMAGAATLSWRMTGNELSTRLVIAVALMSGNAMRRFAPQGLRSCCSTGAGMPPVVYSLPRINRLVDRRS